MIIGFLQCVDWVTDSNDSLRGGVYKFEHKRNKSKITKEKWNYMGNGKTIFAHLRCMNGIIWVMEKLYLPI